MEAVFVIVTIPPSVAKPQLSANKNSYKMRTSKKANLFMHAVPTVEQFNKAK